ncbi:MAG: carboxypeptidase-like regulatory domain-containing protein, partial [Planctomycetota bacterium]
MTPALRKAAILSFVLVALTMLLAVLFLNEPDRDYDTEPGGEPANMSSREKEAGAASASDEIGNELTDGTAGAKDPAAKPEPKSGETTTEIEAPIRLVLLLLDADGEEPMGNEEFNLRMEGPVTRNLLLRTDSDGFAHVTNVPAGEYPTLLRHPRYLSDRRVLTIPPEEPTTEPEVVKVLLEKGKSLTGTVTDRRGRAIGGANVTLHTGTSDGPQARKATSGNDGTFTVEALTVGIWTLTAFHPAYSFAGPLRTEIPAQEELTIQLGESKRLNVFVENPDATPCEG